MEFFFLTIIYIIASFTQGLIGFGFGVFSLPLVAMIFTPGIAVGMNAILGTVNCVYNYILLRDRVNYKKSFGVFFVGVIFIPFGVYFLVSVDEHIVFMVMGIMIILVTLNSTRRKTVNGESVMYGKYGYIFPVLAGMVAGAFVAPGPILAPYMFAKEKDPYVARANLQFIFSMMSIVIITSHIIAKNMTVETSLKALPYIPVVFIFTKIGSWYSFRIKKEVFEHIIGIALFLLGLYIFGKNLFYLIIR